MKKEIFGGILLLIVGGLVYAGLRVVSLQGSEEGGGTLTDRERQAVEKFEKTVLADSVRRQAHWDSLQTRWKAEKVARDRARQVREAAYADSQRVWSARRMQQTLARAERRRAADEWKAHHDSLRAAYVRKLPTGTVVDANSADTTLLKQIPGIGSYYARRIVAYREALGGFVDVRQLAEIQVLPRSVLLWFKVQPGAATRRIPVNRADFKTLVRHPYLNDKQSRAIIRCRNQVMRLNSWADFRGCPEFSPADIARLTPYIAF